MKKFPKVIALWQEGDVALTAPIDRDSTVWLDDIEDGTRAGVYQLVKEQIVRMAAPTPEDVKPRKVRQ